ncbi:hypothetical protein [Noviherbaspirillum pedocola]|uniref:Uncharacterized protein n=1 Tax=Noviherbaspirillum pedocola TaxID=2801341 RepID=A0A934W7M5_9BURK|nr:hypothetical protein [Noviherbaspirillum pedocola]MBK4737622.1 hypothetical protein [Noviherbaspirillum pedocola]
MISSHVLSKIRRIYAGCLKFDDFESSCADEEVNTAMYGSMRGLLRDLCRLAANPSNPEGLRLPPLNNLGMTLHELMQLPYVQRDGKTMRLGAVVFSQFCRHRVAMLLEELFITCSAEELIGAALPVHAEAAHSIDELRHQLYEPTAQQEIGTILMTDLQQAWGARTLRSFFMAQPNAQGYMAWWPQAKVGSGMALPTHAVRTPSGTVSMTLTRCTEDASDPVAAHEWCAELRVEADAVWPDAVAYGMAYVFERDAAGLPLGTVDDMVCASDAVSDVDVQQVDALLAQHGDMPEVIQGSDIAMVWLWERRLGSERGLGAECLLAALRDLSARFPHLHTVAVNMKPAQFNDWEEGIDPPGIVVAKQEAIDALHSHIDALQPGDVVGGETRLFVANRDPDAGSAAETVARAAARRSIRKAGAA